MILGVLFNIKILSILVDKKKKKKKKKVNKKKKKKSRLQNMAWMLMKASILNIVFTDSLIGKSDKSSHST